MKDAVTNKIRLLKNIQPNPDWLKSQRSSLLLHIKSDNETKKVWSLPGFSLPRLAGVLPNFAFKPVLVSLVLFGLIFGGTGFLTVKAAQNSLPGDLFYPAKIFMENTRMKVSSQTSKSRLQAEFVENRTQELSQIMEEKTDNPIEKREKVVKAVDKLQAQVINTKVHLNKIKQSEPKEVIEAVEAVSEKTAQSQDVLVEAKEKITKELTEEESKEVVQAIDEALAVILAAKKAEKEIKVQIEVTKIEEPSEVEESIITSPTIPLKINEASESFEEIEEIIK